MAVIFEFTVEKGFHFAEAFGNRFNMPVENDRVCLPNELGDGFIREVYLDNGLSLCIHNYTLKQAFILKRLQTNAATTLTMKFDCRGKSAITNSAANESLFSGTTNCEAEFGTSNFFTELSLPPNRPIIFLVINTTGQVLSDLLKLNGEGHWIAQNINENGSFVLHESMTQQMEWTLKQLSLINENTRLADMLFKIKAQELIFLLFTKLLERSDSVPLNINQADAEKIYRIKAEILNDLSVAPQLTDLAKKAGMSLTKMKQLFNQVFGKSIYNYYQAERMNEAAHLLNYLSVSETGYKIGFTNLSHFTRLFEKHHRLKPKRFKDKLRAA